MRDATKLRIYFNDDKALFLIPLYQRKYAWQRKHCERLFMDLEKVHKNNLRSHFFGSIVSVKASDRVLTLSTCYSDTERTVVHAKLIKRSVK